MPLGGLPEPGTLVEPDGNLEVKAIIEVRKL